MVKPECQHFLDEIFARRIEIDELQEELAIAPTNQKARIAQRIKELVAEVDRLEVAFDECEDVPPPPTPIEATMASTITVATDDSRFLSLGPVFAALTFRFSQRDYALVAMGFPPTVLGTIPITILGLPILSNTVTARVVSGFAGPYTRADDSLSIPTDFVLDHSAPTLGYSTVRMTLTTGTVSTSLPPGTLSGSPISRAANSLGRVTLVGASVLSDSFAGTAVTAIVRGTLTQFPP